MFVGGGSFAWLGRDAGGRREASKNRRRRSSQMAIIQDTRTGLFVSRVRAFCRKIYKLLLLLVTCAEVDGGAAGAAAPGVALG